MSLTPFYPITVDPLVRQVKKTRIKRDDFKILKVIGRGTFSEVSRGCWDHTSLIQQFNMIPMFTFTLLL